VEHEKWDTFSNSAGLRVNPSSMLLFVASCTVNEEFQILPLYGSCPVLSRNELVQCSFGL
jgi:hypothetical protein